MKFLCPSEGTSELIIERRGGCSRRSQQRRPGWERVAREEGSPEGKKGEEGKKERKKKKKETERIVEGW